MTGEMLPIIDQMNNADDDRERARLLLACPDSIVLKFAGTFDAACRKAGFDLGRAYLLRRLAAMRAVRVDGLLPLHIAQDHETCRQAMAALARSKGEKSHE